MNELLEPKEFRKLYEGFVKSGGQSIMADSNRQHLERVMKLVTSGGLGLEIGCFKGGTSIWLLEHGIGSLHVIDTFKGSPEHEGMDLSNLEQEFTENTAKYWTRMCVFKGESKHVLPHLGGHGIRYDFIYVDGSHDSKDVILDLLCGFQLLKQGGVMVMDDYLWAYHDDQYRNPKPAIDFFLGAFASKLNVIEMGYQVSIQKL